MLKAEEKTREKLLRPKHSYVENIGLPAPEPFRPCTPIQTQGQDNFTFANNNRGNDLLITRQYWCILMATTNEETCQSIEVFIWLGSG